LIANGARVRAYDPVAIPDARMELNGTVHYCESPYAAAEGVDALVVGTVTLIYDHHTRLLPEKLTDLQHESHALVISTLHAHLDHENCLEVVVLRGKSREVQKLADRLISTKGVQHGRLVMSSPETVSRHHHAPHHAPQHARRHPHQHARR